MSNLQIDQTLSRIESKISLIGSLNKKILNTEQAAEFLGYKVSYLYKLTSSKQIKFYKPNGKLNYFKLEDLEEYLLREMNELSELDDSENVDHWKKK